MITKSVKRGIGFLSLFLVFLLTACNQSNQFNKKYPFIYSDGTMGTRFNIKVSLLPDDVQVEQLKLQINKLLDKINSQMSTYLPDSELSVLNRSQSLDWQTVSVPLYEVLYKAKQVNEQSHGAFDVTVGLLVNLWGFGPDPMHFVAPSAKVIAENLKKTGSEHLSLNDTNKTVRKNIPGLYIDLSALAKGYAVDQVALLLEKQGVQHYMVEIGGELRLKGHNIEDSPWHIAIEKPAASSRTIEKILSLTNTSMATSGDYRNFFEVDGVRFSHTIDPRTGSPITHKLASVTILSDTCMDADAWATALTVLGPEKGFELAEKRQIAALFIIKTAAGFSEKSTSAFSRFFKVKS